MDRDALIRLYAFKRALIAVDEWALYLILMYLYKRRFPAPIIVFAVVYGALATITNYKNLEIIERKLGICGWFLWPISRHPPTSTRSASHSPIAAPTDALTTTPASDPSTHLIVSAPSTPTE